MAYNIGIVILAAGKGSRLHLNVAKPLAPIMDNKLIDYSIAAACSFLKMTKNIGEIGIVIGHQGQEVRSYVEKSYKDATFPISFAVQKKQLGTADALRAYFKDSTTAESKDMTLIVCADTPLLSGDDLHQLYLDFINEKLDAICASFKVDNPIGLGRIEHGKEGFRIVEEKDADEAQRKISEVNSGVYLVETRYALKQLSLIDSQNAANEFYLTDLFRFEQNVKALCFSNADSFLGVNDLAQLEKVEGLLRIKHMQKLRDIGVRFINLADSYINDNVVVKKGSLIYPNVMIEGDSVIDENVTVEAGCIIKNSTIKAGTSIKAYSYLEDAAVGTDCSIGPFTRLRPAASIGAKSKIGNFVEIKKAVLKEGVKVSHLSYVGDAHIGKDTNIGCGFITCNYDGKNKHLTDIGEGCFIGSDSQMIAPVKLGDKCFVASGTTVTDDMNAGDFAISRNKQKTLKGLAKKFIK